MKILSSYRDATAYEAIISNNERTRRDPFSALERDAVNGYRRLFLVCFIY